MGIPLPLRFWAPLCDFCWGKLSLFHGIENRSPLLLFVVYIFAASQKISCFFNFSLRNPCHAKIDNCRMKSDDFSVRICYTNVPIFF